MKVLLVTGVKGRLGLMWWTNSQNGSTRLSVWISEEMDITDLASVEDDKV